MAYCTADDCRVYAKHPDLATYVFTGEIAAATGEFEAMVRAKFETPFVVVDQVVVNIVAKWAAGLALLTKRAVAGNTSEYAEQLIAEARAMVKEILANPSMISAPLRVSEVDGQNKTMVLATDNKRIFDMGWPN